MTATRRRVWVYRARALAWLPITALVWWSGLQSAVWVLLGYSAYANFGADWSASEAADDSALREQLADVRRQLEELTVAVQRRDERFGELIEALRSRGTGSP